MSAPSARSGNAFAATSIRAVRATHANPKGAAMDKDRVKGKAKETEGEIQQKWGEAKDKARDRWEDVKDKSEDAADRAEDELDEANEPEKERTGAHSR
jgi:hypothetical protein